MSDAPQRPVRSGRFLAETLRGDPFTTPPVPGGGRVGVVLVNLGTPAKPEPREIRRFLAEFLADPRVVELPRLLWLPILYGAILPLRPRRIRAKYASVWLPEGSPLMVYSRQQADAVQAELKARGHDVDVVLAMRYGEPSLAQGIEQLRAQGCRRILVAPLYPQYSASTTATIVDKVAQHAARLRDQPEFRFIQRFYDDRGYIAAVAHRVRAAWAEQGGRGQKLVMSFHGLPKRSVQLGEPYFAECVQTGRLLAEALHLTPEQYVVTFQSRFGAAEWLQPYTEPTLKALAAAGTKTVDVVCPGFTADCLETLEEIAQEGAEVFTEAGGESLRYIPALNADPAWVGALSSLLERHMQGWETRPPGGTP